MKKQLGVDISGTATLNPATDQVTFANMPTEIELANILVITNVTKNTVIYNFADPSLGAVSLANDVLTLDYDCAAMSASDKLQVYLDIADYEMPTVVIDDTKPVVVGGVSPSGAKLRAKVGNDGGLQLTDAPQPQVGVAQLINMSPTGWIDTTGYQSIVVTFATSGTLTVVYQSTNDPQYPVTGGNAAGWPVNGVAVPAVTLANPTAGATWVFPVTAKYFRVLISAYTSGTLTTVTQLRAAPANFIPSTQSINVAQVTGAAIPAAGAAATANPVPVGGTDTGNVTRRIQTDASGNQQVAGTLPVGWQYGQYNATYGRATQTLTSQTAAQSTSPPVIVGGLDGTKASVPVRVDASGAVITQFAQSTPAEQSPNELLYQMLATLRAIAYYQYQISQGLSPNSAGDEPDVLIADFMNRASSFVNMAN